MKISVAAVLILGCLFLSACQMVNAFDNSNGGDNNLALTKAAQVEIGDGGVLGHNLCGPPCFFGITPGISKISNVKDVLVKNGWSSECEWNSNSNGVNCFSFIIYFDKTNTMVETISFDPSNVTLANIIDQYGPPDLWGVDPLEYGVHPYTTHLSLNYHKLHMEIGLEYQSGKDSLIYTASPSSRVESVQYLSEQIYHYTGSIPWLGYTDYTSQ